MLFNAWTFLCGFKEYVGKGGVRAEPPTIKGGFRTLRGQCQKAKYQNRVRQYDFIEINSLSVFYPTQNLLPTCGHPRLFR